MRLNQLALALSLLWLGCAAPKAPPLDSPVPVPGTSFSSSPASSSDSLRLSDQSAAPNGRLQSEKGASRQSAGGNGRSESPKEAAPDQEAVRQARRANRNSSLPGYQETRRMVPLAVTSGGLEQGQRLYQRYCDGCYGSQGAPDDGNAELSRYGMADLRYPLEYRFGADRRDIFRSIAYGTSPAMSPLSSPARTTRTTLDGKHRGCWLIAWARL